MFLAVYKLNNTNRTAYLMITDGISANAYVSSISTETALYYRKNSVENSSPTTVTSSASSSSTVSISSNAVMISRLFPDSPPKMITNFNPKTWEVITASGLDFLTKSDLSTLSDTYNYAQEQGYDLKYVDDIAIDLATYRKRGDGTSVNNFNDGTNYDKDGFQLTVSLSDEKQKSAERLLKSEGFTSTTIDQGFLQKTLDPGYGALLSRSNFEMLEIMVNHFSNANHTSKSNTEFSNYSQAKIDPKFTKNESVKLEKGVEEHIRVNDTWIKGGVDLVSSDTGSILNVLTGGPKVFDDSILDALLQRIQSLRSNASYDSILISLLTLKK